MPRCPKKMHQRMYAFQIVDVKVPKYAWIKDIGLPISFMGSIHAWELIGSRMEKTGRSLNANSWSPSSVKERNARPRTSQTVSLELFSPAMVEKL